MLIMLIQRGRQTATERTPFAPFAGMLVDVLAAQDQRMGGGLSALMLSAPRLRHREAAAVSLAAPSAAALSSGWVHAVGRCAAALIHN
jgi:hypothetical protein